MSKQKKIGIGLIIGGVVLLLLCGGYFAYTMRNHFLNVSSTKATNSSASDISSKYDNKNYGSNTSLEGTEITKSGNYDLSGEYGCIHIKTSGDVQLNLNNATITCTTGPAIYVEDADVVSITLTGKNKVTATTTEDLDGAIYSTDDLVFSGDGSLEVTSNYDGIVSKDSLIFKEGTYTIKADDDAIRGKDNVAIVNGTFSLTAGGDGIKSTNEEDSSKGYIAIDNGTFTINSVRDGIQAETELVMNDGTYTITTTGNADEDSSKGLKAGKLIEINGGVITLNTTDDAIHSNVDVTINEGKIEATSKDDGIHADSLVEINKGTITINAAEGIEGTYVKINNGTINITASDDGINAPQKSNTYTPCIEINGGELTISMGQGDTDALDSNGDLYINGGKVTITAQFAFDFSGEAKLTGGTVTVNGSEVTTITNSMMEGGGMGGPQGRPQGGPGGRR